ncbi:MAG TPA: SulP family inorganic anion transporter [Myxococcota bacterium]|nr:SulP family inorganic anion transporter [Myxococcota bacterium]
MPRLTQTASPRGPLRLLPAFESLRGYGAEAARADFVAGLTVAAVAVPQAMAYALVAGLPPVYGLYTAIVMTTVGALFNASRQLVNGPTNAISIAVLSVLANVTDMDARVSAAILLALLVGMIQLGITLFRLGDLERYISHSVIVGFTAGASALLALDQLKNLVGLKAVGDAHAHFLVRFWRSLTESGGAHGPTAAVGLGSIALVLLLRAGKRRLGWRLAPDLLAVVIAAAGLTAWLGLDARGVAVIGEIPNRLPSFGAPAFDVDEARSFATGALAIAVLGLLEAISMSKALAAVSGQKLDMNQQCLSEGLANLAGSFFQCMPGSGSLTRSAINQQAGAKTQWSGVISAVSVALVMLVFAPYARYVPRAALAGILMLTAWNMVDWRALFYHLRTTRFDAAIVAATAIAAVGVSIEFCVLIGVFMSFMLTVPRAGQMLMTEFTLTGGGALHERLPGDAPCARILVFGLEGEMFFGATAALEAHFAAMEARLGAEARVLVLRLKRARNPDAVGLTLLDDFLKRVAARGVATLLCGVRAEFADKLERTGMSARLGDRLYLEHPVRLTSTTLAIRRAYEIIGKDTCSVCPRGGHTAAVEVGYEI